MHNKEREEIRVLRNGDDDISEKATSYERKEAETGSFLDITGDTEEKIIKNADGKLLSSYNTVSQMNFKFDMLIVLF